MGQAQSEAAVEQPNEASLASSSTTSAAPPPPPSLSSLITEAAAYGEGNENESLDEKAQKALDCPCIAHLRSGTCGSQFSDAFLCFLKSTAEEKGSDCVHPFVALQNCIKENPNAFSSDILEDDEVKKEEKPVQEYKIIPPIWAMEPRNPKKKT